MKKFAVLFSAIALMFAFSATNVVAQNVPTKKAEKTITAKSETATHSAVNKVDFSDKAAADCSAKSAATSNCAKTCGEAKAKSCCSGTKTASAKPVPAPGVK